MQKKCELLFDQLISAAVITNFALYSFNFIQEENNKKKKKKKKNSDELLVDVAKIMRSTLVCSERYSMASGFDPKFKSAVKGKRTQDFLPSDKNVYIYIYISVQVWL